LQVVGFFFALVLHVRDTLYPSILAHDITLKNVPEARSSSVLATHKRGPSVAVGGHFLGRRDTRAETSLFSALPACRPRSSPQDELDDELRELENMAHLLSLHKKNIESAAIMAGNGEQLRAMQARHSQAETTYDQTTIARHSQAMQRSASNMSEYANDRARGPQHDMGPKRGSRGTDIPEAKRNSRASDVPEPKRNSKAADLQ
jgi:hypothetical protein